MENTKNASLSKLVPVMLCFFAMGFVDLVGIASNYVKADLGLTDSQANIFPSLVFFWFLIFSVPTGMLMSRIGQKKTVLLSLIVTFASLLLPVFGDSYALMLISFTLIRNTIHLSVYSQRFLIKTMQLVGAKPFFICKPFIQNSVWFGFFGSMIADLILLAAIFFLQKEVGSVVNLMNKELIIIMVAFVMVCGILLSLVSSWMSDARYLNKDMNDLYN